SIWAFETSAAFAAKIRRFLFQIFSGQTFSQRIASGAGKRRIWKGAQQSHEQPMSVHRRMPVVAAIKRGRKLAWRRHVCVAIQDMTNLVRVFLADTRERQFREALRRLQVEAQSGFRGCS